MNSGLLIVVSGPAGVGKGTVVRKIIEICDCAVLSVSATSRLPRASEIEGKNYFFKTKEQFEDMIRNDQLIEWVEYCGNYYGTPKDFVCSEINKGHVLILEIEVEGALNVKRIFPDSILCFILPPDYNELENRLRGRGTEDEASIQKRLLRAKDEFELIDKYDYIVINDDIDAAAERFINIIKSEKMRTVRNQKLIEEFKNI
jgi:guanylate kinase